MKIAVIMSVYRAEDSKKFVRALESIFAQEIPSTVDVRIYLGVDGPIPQELERAVNTYRHRIHRLLVCEVNRGLAAVLNDLINLLEDEDFVFRMDTDDASMHTRFRKQLEHMAAHPEVDILGTAIVEVDELTNTRRVVDFGRGGGHKVSRLIARGVPVAHPTVCFRRRVFHKVQGYPLVRYNEDIALWFECLKRGLVIENLTEPLYEFTVSADFFKRRGLKKAFTELEIYMRGVWALRGLSFDLFYPLARFALRVSPLLLQKAAYGSRFRFRDIQEVAVID